MTSGFLDVKCVGTNHCQNIFIKNKIRKNKQFLNFDFIWFFWCDCLNEYFVNYFKYRKYINYLIYWQKRKKTEETVIENEMNRQQIGVSIELNSNFCFIYIFSADVGWMHDWILRQNIRNKYGDCKLYKKITTVEQSRGKKVFFVFNTILKKRSNIYLKPRNKNNLSNF